METARAEDANGVIYSAKIINPKQITTLCRGMKFEMEV